MDDPPGGPQDDAQRLYQMPPAGFIAARAEMAKSLKAGGDADGAAAVARLRKPSPTAWALDRIAASEPERLQELFAANDELRAAMSTAKERAGPRFRAASEERQRVVAGLTERAGAVLEEAGLPANRQNTDRIAATLMATAADPEGADLLRRGVLDRDLSGAGGFDGLFGPGPEDEPGPRDDERKRAEAAARRRGDRERAERDAERLKATAAAADRTADEAERGATAAEQDAERAAKVAAGKRREANRARREADRAAERARSAAERLTDG